MGSRDFFFSVSLHALILSATVITVPLTGKQMPFDEIIRVQLTAPAQVPGAIKPAPIQAPPEPVVEQVPEPKPEPPKPKPKEKPIDETPEKKPEKKEPPKEEPRPAAERTAEESNGESSGEQPSEGSGQIGQTDAPVGAGSPFAGATMDNSNFTYPYWFTQAFNKISSSFHVRGTFPPDIVCVIYFEVIRSGRVIELRVERESGYPDFDDACLTAVSRATPFPPLPREFTDEVLGINLPFKPPR